VKEATPANEATDGIVMPTPEQRKWSRADYIAITLVVLVAGFTRMLGIAHPPQLIFDETYYAKDACWYVNASESLCERGPDNPEVHPPLGKWLIGIGIRLFGFDSFGWRISSAVAGTATVALLFLLARRLFASTVAATVTSGLLAFDFLHFVQSRTSMLDIFVPLFGVAGFYLLVLDRERMIEDAPNRGLLDRPWRLGAGACFGAAVATKWSGGLLLLAALALTVVWEIAAHREVSWGTSIRRFLRSESLSVVMFLMIVPFLVYLLSYAGRVQGSWTDLPWKEGTVARNLWNHHDYMLDFHKNLESTHSYQSPAWSWLLLKRPVSYYFCSDGTSPPCPAPAKPGDYGEVFATGNPFVWWTSIAALGYVAYRWSRSRDMRGPEGLLLAGFGFSFLPWLVLGRPAIFIFYLLPTIPFMCLALGYVASRIGRSWEATAAIAIFSAATLGAFAFYYPLLTGKPIPYPQWQSRIWVFDHCDKPVGDPATATITETVNGQIQTRVQETTSDTSGLPPTGWCWI
jgi:dolichyl-phosphate-mannose--protein O-mannosyl transferase